jgi:hypothetical protein
MQISSWNRLLYSARPLDSFRQCYGAGAEFWETNIKLPLGTGAIITNCGSGSFLFMKVLKKFFRKKSWYGTQRSFL